MFNVNQMLKPASQFLKVNAPAILTAFGAVGVVGTAVLTGKASFEAARQIDALKEDRKRMVMTDPTVSIEVTKTDAIKLVAPLYVAAVFSGVLSCGAIVMSHRISSKRAAMLAAAYALNEGKLEEYQDKIKEKLGVKKEKDVRDSLTQDRVNRDYDESEVLLFADDNKVLMREDYTGRFFYGNVEMVNNAVNQVNARILKEGSARISDFYDLLHLSHVSTSDYFGWIKDDPLEVDWSTCTTPDGSQAVHSFEYKTHPVQDPEREAGRSFR